MEEILKELQYYQEITQKYFNKPLMMTDKDE